MRHFRRVEQSAFGDQHSGRLHAAHELVHGEEHRVFVHQGLVGAARSKDILAILTQRMLSADEENQYLKDCNFRKWDQHQNTIKHGDKDTPGILKICPYKRAPYSRVNCIK